MLKKKLAVNGGKPVRNSFLVFGNPIIEKEEIDYPNLTYEIIEEPKRN